jgi:hypothetical protein
MGSYMEIFEARVLGDYYIPHLYRGRIITSYMQEIIQIYPCKNYSNPSMFTKVIA